MNFEVDYNKTLEIGNSLKKEVLELDNILKEILLLIEELKGCWSGIDYDNFSQNTYAYIKNLNFNIEELKFLANFIEVASKCYSDTDDDWEGKLKKIGEDKKWPTV